MERFFSRRLLIVLVIFLPICASCGKRGDPLPPFRRVPAIVNTLSLHQRGSQLFLSWNAPRTNQDGTTENIALVEANLLRRVIDVDTLAEEQRQAELLLRLQRPRVTIPVSLAATSTVEESAATNVANETRPVTTSAKDNLLPAETSLTNEESVRPLTDDPIPISIPQNAEAASLVEQALEDRQESSLIGTESLGPTPIPLKLPPFELEGMIVASVTSTEPGQSLNYQEEIDESWIGMRVEYAVRYRNRKNREGALSRIVAIAPVPKLPTPRAPVAQAEDGYVRVGWESVEKENEPRLGYDVLRRSVDEPEYSEVPINLTPMDEPEFQDTTAPFGEESCYVIKAVALVDNTSVTPDLSLVPNAELSHQPELSQDRPEVLLSQPEETQAQPGFAKEAQTQPELLNALKAPFKTSERAVQEELGFIITVPPLPEIPSIESNSSSEVCLVPKDLFAPPKPVGLVTMASPTGVRLSWDAVQAPDLKGYLVYRSDTLNELFLLLTSEPIAVSTYVDSTATPGSTVYYAVSAVDMSPAENESEKSSPMVANVP